MSLKVTTSSIRPDQIKTDVLIVPVTGENTVNAGISSDLNKEIVRLMRDNDFTNEWGKAMLLAKKTSTESPMVAVLGLGSDELLDRQAEAVRRGVGKIVQELRTHGLKSVSFSVWDQPDAAILAGAAIEGAELASYRFVDYSERLKKQQQRRSLREITILSSPDTVKMVAARSKDAQEFLKGVTMARNLVNRPADHMSPAALVKEARDIAKSPNISVRVLDKSQAAKEKFNAFLAVARGSTNPPYVIHLTYKPKRKAAKKIFLVGKGVTFDSGGLSIKPAEYMETMKMDMAGAAVVLGVFKVLNKLNLPIEVHGVIAACENMPSGSAYRPGDVLFAKNGKTIEVANTDAEGRLTLADALAYASEYSPDAIVDVATLTGACMVALGETVAGLFGNNNALLSSVQQAGQVAGEMTAILPMPEEYKPLLESHIADLRNISSSMWGGAITAALFLQEFVGKTPWVHIDIAGPAFAEHQRLPYYSHGATGFGVRLLLEFLRSNSN